MDPAVIAALIGLAGVLFTAACSVLAQKVIAAQQAKELYAKLDKQSELADEKLRGEIAVIETEISELSARVEKHNRMVERTYELERRMDVQEEKTKVANHRIDDLERDAKRA